MTRLWALVMCLCGLAACDARPNAPAQAYVKTVTALKKAADQNVAQGRLVQAEVTLRQLVSLPVPDVEPNALQLVQDGYFSLCSVMLATGRASDAAEEATYALTLSDAPTVFKANLHAVRAMALEATNRSADALSDYEAALGIHKQLFDKALASHKGDSR